MESTVVVNLGDDGDERHSFVDQGHEIADEKILVGIEARTHARRPDGRRIAWNSTGISAFSVSVVMASLLGCRPCASSPPGTFAANPYLSPECGPSGRGRSCRPWRIRSVTTATSGLNTAERVRLRATRCASRVRVPWSEPPDQRGDSAAVDETCSRRTGRWPLTAVASTRRPAGLTSGSWWFAGWVGSPRRRWSAIISRYESGL